MRIEIEADRVRLAEVRAEAQALAREAELAARRLAAIAADCEAWTARKEGAASQIATLDARVNEAKTERAGLEDAPRAFAEQRSALIGEIEAAEAVRRAAADRLAEAENTLADADRDARAALEAVGAAREEAARAEERHEGGKRRLADVAHEIQEMLEVEPAEVGEPRRASSRASALPDVAEVEAKLERLRRERERLGAVNLRAEEELREVETQHGDADQPSATTWSRRSSGCARASRTSTARRASGCSPPSRWSTATSSICSPSCSAAAPRNCS